VFELQAAGAGLVFVSLLRDELRGLAGESRLRPVWFPGEPGDERVVRMFDAGFGVSDAALDLLDVAKHGACAVGVEAEEVALVDHATGPACGKEELPESRW